MQTEPRKKMLMAGGSVNTAVYSGRQYTFGTLPPGYLYVEAAFQALSTFQAPRVAVLRDTNEVICNEAEVRRVSQLYPDMQLFDVYEVDPTDILYKANIRSILLDLKANGVESVVGCSYLDLCIQVRGTNAR